uniref:Uncharacterized protein n=1 Tax=Anguilla anguilla TaxID=7936 RepID=A0A0E9RL11_ANGAN
MRRGACEMDNLLGLGDMTKNNNSIFFIFLAKYKTYHNINAFSGLLNSDFQSESYTYCEQPTFSVIRCAHLVHNLF